MLLMKGPRRWINLPSWDQMPTVWSKEPESTLQMNSTSQCFKKTGNHSEWRAGGLFKQLVNIPHLTNAVFPICWNQRRIFFHQQFSLYTIPLFFSLPAVLFKSWIVQFLFVVNTFLPQTSTSFVCYSPTIMTTQFRGKGTSLGLYLPNNRGKVPTKSCAHVEGWGEEKAICQTPTPSSSLYLVVSWWRTRIKWVMAALWAREMHCFFVRPFLPAVW